MNWHEEEQYRRRLSAAAQAAVEEFLPTVMRNPTTMQKCVARIVALAAFTSGVTDDDAIQRLFHRRSGVLSDARKVRDALRPVMGDFLMVARDRMAAA
ncbi:hypothetical protein EV663_11662 [Rhodovulum bhavnagarense]|uniref:Uncharacterized protein n=1 Tax=Rhodovulum bhavnagarense TaxID=992286 RepID=A0A4V6NRJ2_9RHOB|nr:hypothetical protein [Rhodovulum bhavnagarense]TCP59766.1 hypothetical protein EV663_11662 [Rhodovulum bhavnagarense]